ncbi:MAG: rhodanese-like domain-containing protein [Gallionella sp.]|nr:rhodanese-like domain-containing protein [Gallionella sp.]
MQHLTPRQAYDFLQANSDAILVDVRSEIEHLFVGHPKGAILIPWVDGADWDINPNFVAQVKKAASLNRPVVLFCRSGQRSVDAGQVLERAGLENVYNMLHGFEGDLDHFHQRSVVNGWRFDGLPWLQT